MINLFAIFVSEDGKQLPSLLFVAIFKFYAEKCPKDAEDAEIGELCGSAPPHPVRCPAYGKRTFSNSVAAPLLWNNLPNRIRTITCLSSFKRSFYLVVSLSSHNTYDVSLNHYANRCEIRSHKMTDVAPSLMA